jgi:hypothetical protein
MVILKAAKSKTWELPWIIAHNDIAANLPLTGHLCTNTLRRSRSQSLSQILLHEQISLATIWTFLCDIL